MCAAHKHRLEFIGNITLFFSALFAVLSRSSVDPGLTGFAVTYALQLTGVCVLGRVHALSVAGAESHGPHGQPD